VTASVLWCLHDPANVQH